MTRESIYVLSLERNKFYIGKTKNILNRVSIHSLNPSCSWTKKYKIRDIIEIKQCNGPFDEDSTTKEYMDKYGIDNVR